MKTVCYNCDGTGYILVGPNAMDEDDYEECVQCLGTGEQEDDD